MRFLSSTMLGAIAASVVVTTSSSFSQDIIGSAKVIGSGTGFSQIT